VVLSSLTSESNVARKCNSEPILFSAVFVIASLHSKEQGSIDCELFFNLWRTVSLCGTWYVHAIGLGHQRADEFSSR
jgi:hypothetical protein